MKETMEFLKLADDILAHMARGESLPEALIYSVDQIFQGLDGIWNVPEELLNLDSKESAELSIYSMKLLKKALIMLARKI